jgi:Pentapeptide repeats (8 copies)
VGKKPEQTAGTVSSKKKLDAASARKLELETKLIEDQLTPAGRRRETLKAVAGASGLILAFVAVIGGLFSILNWLFQENRNRDLRIQERMDRSLGLLSETRPTQRVAAISSLQSFIATSDDTRNSQVLVSIANALPLEEDGTVRNAMLSLFEDLDAETTGKQALDVALKSLAHNSRGLMRASDLWNKNPRLGFYRIAETIKEGAALEAIARAITVLLRKGARVKDLSEIYLPDSDLSSLDLTGINFDFSILALTDFSNAILTGASFNDANLEHVYFVRSDLRFAKLNDQRKLGYKQPFDSYIGKQFENSSKNLAMISLPDFSCADLRNAVFSNHALFGIWRNEVPTDIYPVNFAGQI